MYGVRHNRSSSKTSRRGESDHFRSGQFLLSILSGSVGVGVGLNGVNNSCRGPDLASAQFCSAVRWNFSLSEN